MEERANFIDCRQLMEASGTSVAMGQRKDTSVARHTGGWIVLGSGLLLMCLLGAWAGQTVSPLVEPRLSDTDELGSWSDPSRFPKLQIDVNQAGEAELSCIEGIGPALARRIVEYRQRHGPFRTLDDLDKVPGVGPALVRRMETAIQPLGDRPHVPEAESDIVITEPARLAGRTSPLPLNEPLHD